jgi:hypothetical protein
MTRGKAISTRDGLAVLRFARCFLSRGGQHRDGSN